MSGITGRKSGTLLFWSGVGVFLLAMLQYRDGINASPDSWAFWEGSATWLATGRFDYFTGEPILSWLPTFSFYLAGWEYFLGPTGRALVAAMVALVTAAFFGWGFFLLRVLDIGGEFYRLDRLRLPLLIATGLTVVCTQSLLHAQVLQFAFVPLFLAGCVGIAAEGRPRDLALTALAFTGALLAHHSSLYLGGIALLAAVACRGSVARKVCVALICIVPPVAVWHLVRAGYGQTGSHTVGIGQGMHSPLEYLRQIALGFCPFFQPSRLPHHPFWFAGLLALDAWLAARFLRRHSGQERAWPLSAPMLLGWLALAGLFALFNIVLIGDPLSGRFLIAPVLLLTMGTSLLALLDPAIPRPAQALICALLFFKPAERAALNAARGLDFIPQPTGYEHIYPNWTLAGSAKPGRVRIVPPRPGLLEPVAPEISPPERGR